MHVAFIATPDLSYVSGSSLSLRYTVEALGRAGVVSTVFCQHGPVGAHDPAVSYVELPIPLDYQVTTDTRPDTADLADCLTQLVNAVVALPRIDVIHAIYGTFTGAAAVVAGAMRVVPVVVTTFGRDVTLGATVDERYRRLMRIAYGHADLVVAADDEAAELVRAGYTGDGTDVRVIPPGVNFAIMRRAAGQRTPRARGRRILAVQSSFNRNKGLGLLLDAVSELSTTMPDVELTVAGHDDTPGRRIEAELHQQASRLGVSANVRFLGHLSHEGVMELMTECDVFVDPRTINSFSSCVYEAMAVGLPVVASDVACNREATGDGDRGLLAAVGDPHELARAIGFLLADDALADRLRGAARDFAGKAERSVSCEVVAGALAEEYRQLLDREESSRRPVTN